MKALRIDTGTRVAPFGDRPSASWIGQKTSGEIFSEALTKRGIELVDVEGDVAAPSMGSEPGGWVVVADHTFMTDKCLGDFLAIAVELPPGAYGLALALTPASDYGRPASSVVVEDFDASGPGAKPEGAKGAEAEATQRCAYDAFFVAGAIPVEDSAPESANALLERLRSEATRIVVKKREIGIPVRMPLLGDEERTKMIFPITSTVAGHVEHWVHVLWLNHLAFGIRWNEILRGHKGWAIWRGLLSFPYNFPAASKRFVRHGKNVKIHPTAHVEGSILGDDVVIGARASVRNSILGNGVEIADHGSVIASTVGDRAYVTPKTFLVWSCVYPDAVVSNYKLQMSVVGRGAATSQWAGFIDAKFQGSIDIFVNGEKRSTERSFLGSCIGHHGYIGAKVLMMPGRELPNDCFVTMRPDELIQEVPSDLPAGVPVMRDGGTLVPIR